MRTDMRGARVLLALLVAPGLAAGLRFSRLEAWQAREPRAARGAGDDAAIDRLIGQQCTKCHVRPPPEYVPRGLWRFRVQAMAEHAVTGTGLPAGEESLLWQSDLDRIIRWFEARAPEALPLPPPWPEDDGGLRFAKHAYDPAGTASRPVVSNVRFFDLDGDGRLEIVACDMGRGSVFVADPARSPATLTRIAVLQNPAHAEMVDLDQDGRQDLLIADLGEFLPSDHEKGTVVWLRQTGPMQFEKRVLLDRLPRNADVQAADFDGDSDLDLVVASFGFRKAGSTLYYENETTDWKEPRFVGHVIDARPGAIHVPPVDLDKDGRMDFLLLVSQQHEHLVAYLNRGRGRGFRPETVFRAVTPVWGASGVQPVDFDGDGDTDVVMTNGDSLDDFTIRPFHGVRLLENRGGFPFAQRDLAAMPGVHRAQVADMDGDGDNDVVACAFLPGTQHPQFRQLGRQGNVAELTAVGWIEQARPGEFRLHSLRKGIPGHVTLDLGDFDRDGDVDLVIGNFTGFTSGETDTGLTTDTWVELWENQTPRPLAQTDATSSGCSDRVDLRSPSGAVGLRFRLAARDGKTGVPVYGVTFEGRELVKESSLGLDLDSGPLDSGLRVVRVSRRSVDETIRGDFGKASSARDRYEESVVSLAESGGRGRRLDVALRAYDDGIAFRYVVPGQEGLADFVIREEKTDLSFGGEPTLYGLPLPFGSAYEGQYQVGPLAKAEGVQYGLPLLLEYPDGTHVGVTEANLTDYAGLYLAGVPGRQGLLRSRLAPSTEGPRVKVRATAPHLSPWRVIMIGRGPGALIESNLVTSLNEPPRIADTSWIRPGKVQFPWWNAYHMPEMRGRAGLNTETLKRYIDFAGENGIEHHSIDGIHRCGGARGEAWYGGPIDTYEGADITKAIPEIDLPEVLAYARGKGVRTRLWLHWQAVDEHMDRAFPLYEQWGIEGVMVDFMNSDSQEMVRFVHRVLKKAAEHRLTVSLHGSYKPTGIRRTYPNLMTTEAVFNLEQNKWSPTGSTPEHELLVPFIRMLAGPLDYHQGSFKPVSPARYKPRYTAPNAIGTLTRQLAMYVVYENPMPMVADYPAAYQGHPAFKFVREVPTVWDETRVLEGQVGRHIAIARRRGRDWYVGCMTDRQARAVRLPLGFLGEGGWTAEVYRDHPESGRDPERFEIRRMRVTASHSIEARLAPAGGLAIRLTPARQGGT